AGGAYDATVEGPETLHSARATGKSRSGVGSLLAVVAILAVAAIGLLLAVLPGSKRDSGKLTRVTSLEGPVDIRSYQARFQGPQPASGWEYSWNQTGPIGNPTNYSPLLWDGRGVYNCDGKPGLPRAQPGWYLNLGGNRGHPGAGSKQKNGVTQFDLYAIAAY